MCFSLFFDACCLSLPHPSRDTFFLNNLHMAFPKNCFFLTLMSLDSSSWVFSFPFLYQSAQAMLLFSPFVACVYTCVLPFCTFSSLRIFLSAKKACCQKGECKTGHSQSNIKVCVWKNTVTFLKEIVRRVRTRTVK